MTTTSAPPASSARVRVQRFGTFLSGMIMPNIAAFIAWGFITAFFIQTGWTPVPQLGGFPDAAGNEYTGLVGPMIVYLLPLLIANTGGRMVYGTRGGVVASIATMGVIVGTSVPMFLGAMIVGPLAAYLMKKVDALWAGKIRAGFEMLVDNFSAGILGFGLAILAFFGLSPVFTVVSDALGAGARFLTETGLLPLASLVIEPGKVLFLNNAINQGVLTPLGIQEASSEGKSILFLLEANPGPGLGLLLAFAFFGVGIARATAPGAIIIQFLGGIHEIYFPYALSKPMTIHALIAGGATGVTTNMVLGGGLAFPAAPGSIIAVTAAASSPAAGGIANLLVVYLSVLLAATVTFLITAVILRASRKRDLLAEADTFGAAIAQTEANKGKSSA
ncbi:MAG: PTS mannitol transporter subunit IICB, partial [Microcella sp.]|uniref:PTS mannitol transporter subunit IICB n=1 Tax=Microcella sp. TaxID=1913979 RepID=UPI00271F7063